MLHGGDTYGMEGVVDFSANLNPLGTPPQVIDALQENLHAYDTYPDLQCRDLVAAIAEHEGVAREWIVAGAGASDLFLRLALALKPKRAYVPTPDFSGYEYALRQVGCMVANALDTHADIAFLSSPNNPTGLVLPQSELLALLDDAKKRDAHVVLDESFAAFADMPSAVDLCADYPQLIVVKSLTKLYAIAGLRLGYAVCSDANLVSALANHGAEWAVPTPAQVAGVAALHVDGWIQRTRSYVACQRNVLLSGLEALGLEVVHGQANYLLFRCDKRLRQPLLERGFAIRTCESFEGLGADWYRIAVRTEMENAALLKALQEVLA